MFVALNTCVQGPSMLQHGSCHFGKALRGHATWSTFWGGDACLRRGAQRAEDQPRGWGVGQARYSVWGGPRIIYWGKSRGLLNRLTLEERLRIPPKWGRVHHYTLSSWRLYGSRERVCCVQDSVWNVQAAKFNRHHDFNYMIHPLLGLYPTIHSRLCIRRWAPDACRGMVCNNAQLQTSKRLGVL